MTSPAWLADYTSALHARDQREKAQEAHIHAYTKLADRTARLEADRLAAPPSAPAPPSASPQPTTKPKPSPTSRFGRSSPATPTTPTTFDPPPPPSSSSDDPLTRLRADLAATQTSRAALSTQLADAQASTAALQARAAKGEKSLAEQRQRAAVLERRLRDRESEVKGKTRLVEEVQDELVSVNLQLNMAEQRSEELERENRELVDRWMKYKREEAERMNDLSRWE